MRLYNLTDQVLPKQTEAYPITLKKAGIILEPGEFFDVPDGFDMGKINSWVTRGLVSVGKRPDWYIANRKKVREGPSRKSRSLPPKKTKGKEEK